MEEYVLRTFALLEDPSRRELFSITIEGTFGTETLGSANELRHQKFSDTISSVELRALKSKARLSIRFERDRFSSLVIGESEGANEREVWMGRFAGIEHVLEQSRTSAWFFDPPLPGFHGVFGLVGNWIAVFGLGLALGFFKGNLAVSIGILAAAMTGLLYQVAGVLNPYTRFASRRDDNMQRVWRWFGGGFATFVVFGSLLFLLRKKILGF